jgi:hypothetical protein
MTQGISSPRVELGSNKIMLRRMGIRRAVFIEIPHSLLVKRSSGGNGEIAMYHPS